MKLKHSRERDIEEFYSLLSDLENKTGGKKVLSIFSRSIACPQRGAYFFFESGEIRRDGQPRVVRVGTHALRINAQTTLRKRLLQHRGFVKGRFAGGGNHRGSVFRQHIGFAIIAKEGIEMETWGHGSDASLDLRKNEHFLEKKVSDHIRSLPFLYLAVNDPSGPASFRGYIERNSIALLSNCGKEIKIDPASDDWLGLYARSEEIRCSGLWNSNHVREEYDKSFIEKLRRLILSL